MFCLAVTRQRSEWSIVTQMRVLILPQCMHANKLQSYKYTVTVTVLRVVLHLAAPLY